MPIKNPVAIALIGLLCAGIFKFYFADNQPLDTTVVQEVDEDDDLADDEETDQEETPEKINVALPSTPAKNTAAKPTRAKPNSPKAKYPNLDKSFLPFDKEGNILVTQVTVDGERLTFQGDLLIGETKDLDKLKKQKSLKISKPILWPGGKVPFTIDESIADTKAIEQALTIINDRTDVEFSPRQNEKAYVNFTLGEKNCYSYVGTLGRPQPIYLSPQCGVREVLHELMHTLGFFHEQNRGDRDSHLEVFWDNIETKHHINFKKIPLDFMFLTGQSFSTDTIMLYPSMAFATDPQEPSMLTTDGERLENSPSVFTDTDADRVNAVY